jgi:5S rRNA maturation endonuclease (ribonuclease M5)/ABC-type Mn2+/Zn2+ transport system ATPase subunit
MGTVVGKTQCPSCATQGGDTHRDNLIIYDDGSSYCFACGYYESSASKGNYNFEKQDKEETMSTFTTTSILNKRGVEPKIIKEYGVKTIQSKHTGEFFVEFPIVDVNGAKESWQRRAVNTTNGTLSKEILHKKGAPITNPLFGWDVLRRKLSRTKTILVCEGCTDTLCAASALSHRDDIGVVGILSASYAKKAAAFMVRYLENKKIILAFDNDDAGEKATQEVYQYVKHHASSINLNKISFPAAAKGKAKDVCDLVQLSKTEDAGFSVEELVDNASSFFAKDVVSAPQITSDFLSYLNGLHDGDYMKFSFSPSLTNSVRLLPGKLVAITGDAGKGKSTLVEHMMLDFLAAKKNVFMISAEMRPEEVALKLLRTITGVNYYDTAVVRSLSDKDKKDLEALCYKVTQSLYLFGRFGQCTVEEIDQRIYELEAADQKPELLVIDHLLAISSEGSTEELESIAKSLKGLAEKHSIPIIVLCHTRKPQVQNSQKIYRPKLSDIYNSGALARYADIVLGVALDPAQRITYVETLKLERMGGGYIDIQLKFEDWRLYEIEDGAPVSSLSSFDDDEDEFVYEQDFDFEQKQEEEEELPKQKPAPSTKPQPKPQPKQNPEPAPSPQPQPEPKPKPKPEPEPEPSLNEEEQLERTKKEFEEWQQKIQQNPSWWHYHLVSGKPII